MTGTGHGAPPEGGPLRGTVVLDCSRMLPGAVLSRILLDLGARLVKVEDPDGGDPMRHAPPLVDGIGAGFCAFFRGAESVVIDLRDAQGAAVLRALVRHADVLVESFRPGTMDAWGVGLDRLHELNPALVSCSLNGFGRAPGPAGLPGHDLNFVALTGALDLLGASGVPGIQLADVTAGVLASSAILAALLRRHRTGKGGHVEQPLAAAPLPFLTWAWADAAAGDEGLAATLLRGHCPSYRRYRCADGREIAVAALEPKFWGALVAALDLPHLAGAGLDSGEDGTHAAEALAAVIASRPMQHWVDLGRRLELPVSPVSTPEEGSRDALMSAGGWIESTPAPDGTALATPAPFLPSLGRTPQRAAPRLGEHSRTVLNSIGTRRPG